MSKYNIPYENKEKELNKALLETKKAKRKSVIPFIINKIKEMV